MNRDWRCNRRDFLSLSLLKSKESFGKNSTIASSQKSSTEEVQDEGNHEGSVRLSI
nr:MAG TPA: hypothetical protein [Caudoviricetes sp.]